MNNTAADILEKAADDIATNGLAKYVLLNRGGQHCAVGAIACAMGMELLPGNGFVDDSNWRDDELIGILDALASHVVSPSWHGSSWNKVVAWNNALERTPDEVVEAMRQAAKDLRNEATPS